MTSLLDAGAGELDRSGSIAGLLASWPDDPVAVCQPVAFRQMLSAEW